MDPFYEEQIDKHNYYGQQGSGDLTDYTGRLVGRGQRGHGALSSLARRFAFPAMKSLFTYARPLVKGVFNEAKTIAADTLKDTAVRKLQDLTNKLTGDTVDAQSGNGHTTMNVPMTSSVLSKIRHKRRRRQPIKKRIIMKKRTIKSTPKRRKINKRPTKKRTRRIRK